MHYCDGMLPSIPRRPFCPHRPFSVGHCSWLDFIFHYAPKTIRLPYLNTTWSKEKKKKQPTLHLWKAQTYVASGVEAGITAFKGRLEWPHLQCGCVVLQQLLLYMGTMYTLRWQWAWISLQVTMQCWVCSCGTIMEYSRSKSGPFLFALHQLDTVPPYTVPACI